MTIKDLLNEVEMNGLVKVIGYDANKNIIVDYFEGDVDDIDDELMDEEIGCMFPYVADETMANGICFDLGMK